MQARDSRPPGYYSASNKTHILIFDDHPILAMGVELSIRKHFSQVIVSMATNEKEARRIIQEVDILLLDVVIPNMNTPSFLREILETHPKLKVLMISQLNPDIYAHYYIALGAKGFIRKDSSDMILRRAIKTVLNEGWYFTDEYGRHQVEYKIQKRTISGNPFVNLSSREIEICTLLLQGLGITEICNLLAISKSTAGTHKKRILEKLNAKNLMEMNELAQIHGFWSR